VPLINLTRVANGQLPPVTIDGPPSTGSCVPRKITGACGSLWDALMHERNLENMGIEGTIMWWDARGLGRLQEGTLLHFPVSGIEMENLGCRSTRSAASAARALHRRRSITAAPVALPRCG
jgi:hypothetical protein